MTETCPLREAVFLACLCLQVTAAAVCVCGWSATVLDASAKLCLIGQNGSTLFISTGGYLLLQLQLNIYKWKWKAKIIRVIDICYCLE